MLSTDSINSYNMQVPEGRRKKDKLWDKVTTAVEWAGALQAKGTQPLWQPLESGGLLLLLDTVLKDGQESAKKNPPKVPREYVWHVLAAQ